MNVDRREFLNGSLAAGAMGLACLAGHPTKAHAEERRPGLIQPGHVVLFQGDSITDTGRSRETADQPNLRSTLGSGYAWLAASQVLVDHPDAKLKFYNRGISGNKVPDLDKRWDADCIALKPDVLSILIGVNDYWHRRDGRYNGTLQTYETGYRALLQRTLEKLPNVKLVLCEPFALKTGKVDDSWFPEIDGYRAVAKKMSEEFKTVFVPFQQAFGRAVAYAEPKEWAADGVHPSSSGAALMAHEWLNQVQGA